MVDLYYLGYHLNEEGKIVIKEIKILKNKNKLINLSESLEIEIVNTKLNYLLNKPSPYVIKNGKRQKRSND